MCVAELQLHQQRVDVHCQDLSDILTSCRKKFQELQTLVQQQNQNLLSVLSSCGAELHHLQTSIQEQNQDGLQVALSSSRQYVLPRYQRTVCRWTDLTSSVGFYSLEVFASTLQHHLERHTEASQRLLTHFRQTVQNRLEEARKTSADLLKSFR